MLKWDFEKSAIQKETEVTKKISLVDRFLAQHWYNYESNETLRLKTRKIYTNLSERSNYIFFLFGSAAYIKLLNKNVVALLLYKIIMTLKSFFFL